MSGTLWIRLAAVAGVAFALVLLISTFFGGTIPPPSRSASDIVGHYVDNRGAILFQAWLGGIAVGILFPPFLVGLITALRQEDDRLSAESLVILAAGLLFAVCALIGSAVQGATAYLVVRSTNPDVVQALNTTARLILSFVWFPLTLLVGTAALAGLRRVSLPQWYGWVSGVVALLMLIASLGVFSLSDPLRPGGGLTYLAFLAVLVWTLASSSILGQPERPAATP